MVYMSRLGMWGPGTPFREFSDFIQAVEKRYYINCYSPANQAVLNFDVGILIMIFLYSFRGVGPMEIVAMDMKVRSIVFYIVIMLNHSQKKGY